MTTKSTSRHQRPVTVFPAVSTHDPPPRRQSVAMKPSPPSRTHTHAPTANLTTSVPLLSPTEKYLKSSLHAKAKHGKERMSYAELSTREVEQYAQAPIASGSSITPDIDVRAGKRRRLSVSRYEDAWQSEEDARLLNKAFRNAEDDLVVKDAQIAALRQELLHAQTSHHRKESELRQDLLFLHIMAQQRATRDHEKEKIGLHRLVAFLRVDHEKQTETLKEQHRSELESERTRHQQALAQALKEKQHAVDRSHSAYLQVQNMHTVMEHANAVAKTFESDLDDLRRLDIEEAEQREKDRRGLPPSYDSISAIDKYISPYGANRNRDNGTLDLDNIETTITSNFMRDLRAANRTSLALREHEERSRACGAGSMLFHSAMLAFATACQHLRSLLENAIESHLEPNKSCGIVDNNEGPPRQSSRSAEFDVNSPVFKLPTLAELGIPVHLGPAPASSDTRTVEHPIDLFRRAPAAPIPSINEMTPLPGVDAIIAVTDRISNTIFDLCTHVFAALDVREYCSEKLCNNKCIRLGQWLRLADDTLLQCLKRRLEATAVEDVFLKQVDQSLTCEKCKSDHCGGYCLRLHMLSYNITRLKSIRRTLDKVSSSTRAGVYFNDTMNWLRDNLEKERELSAKAALPPGRQVTPVMTDEEMALAMQYSVLDATQAAAQRAIQREDPPDEVARRLQAVRDLHFPGPRYRIVSAIDGTSSTPSSPAGESDSGQRHASAGQSNDRIETFVNRAHRHAEPPGVSSSGTRTSSSLAGDRSALLFHDGSPRPSASGVQTRAQHRMAARMRQQSDYLQDDDV
ncbi:unnamed protein product [Cercospora beticola]|nr:unnamed protein product [Cercospora beticola]